jgi:hypothetical protein
MNELDFDALVILLEGSSIKDLENGLRLGSFTEEQIPYVLASIKIKKKNAIKQFPGKLFNKIKHSTLERIKRLKRPRDNDTKYWYQKPIGIIGLAVIGAVLAALVILLIRTHFGIPL